MYYFYKVLLAHSLPLQIYFSQLWTFKVLINFSDLCYKYERLPSMKCPQLNKQNKYQTKWNKQAPRNLVEARKTVFFKMEAVCLARKDRDLSNAEYRYFILRKNIWRDPLIAKKLQQQHIFLSCMVT